MIISRKKYEKLNDDLIDAKAKVDNAKKSLDDENKIMRATLLVKEQRDQYKAERDTLIDDLSWYKAKVSRLEENNDRLTDGVKTLEIENANKLTLNWELKGYADMYKGDSDEYKTLLSEFSQHIGNKPSSSTYKYFRAKLDALEIKEDE
ncbi:putative uncharacterized protein [Staphylococcus equorum subsp. equorum Mu2]|uniref:hypothetical protein n=1 Tax=Staphylococcus equorum TaxID=246432 RepID=UPI000267DDD3|nr:hypothetical protein [Staphylococcus equorum]CCI60081.1 putative uncharacterized protein [Staphylococcus equorum subsp. equorum Mu2]